MQPDFVAAFDAVQRDCYNTAKAHGFHTPEQDNVPVKLMLIVSELREALEANRTGHPQSEKIPEYTNFEEECADAVIRLMDLACMTGARLSAAILAKQEYNRSRPFMHGGKAY